MFLFFEHDEGAALLNSDPIQHHITTSPEIPSKHHYGTLDNGDIVLQISSDDDSDPATDPTTDPASSELSPPYSPPSTPFFASEGKADKFSPIGIPSTASILHSAQLRLQIQQNARTQAGRVSHREIKRDWAFGIITGHRIITLLCVITLFLDDYWIQDILWPVHVKNTGVKALVAKGAFLWLTCLVPCVCGMIGMMLFRHNDRLDQIETLPHLVVWRIVSRGTNQQALAETVQRTQEEMKKCPLFPYVIETVTDTKVDCEDEDVICLTVPTKYETAGFSKFKARALHYALEYSNVPQNAWLVHLDEETRPTSSGIKGIAAMIQEEEKTGKLRIGQGAILYHRSWKEYPVLTLADMMRTGDDVGRFYLQHLIGVTLFGLHGSYIVCRNDVEKRAGFDFGPVGSITEDAFWALRSMELGSRCRWVDGYLEEQSTQSVLDFIKQRRRWFHGLVLVSLYAPVHLGYRVILFMNTILWSLSPLGLLYTIFNLAFQCSTSGLMRGLANFSLAFFLTLYITGVEINLTERGEATLLKRMKWFALTIIMLPWFSLIESAGVFYALIKPETGFHVVQK